MDKQPELSLLEQAVGAEVAYYQQSEQFTLTPEDEASWQRNQDVYALLRPFVSGLSERYVAAPFARHVLERHGYSFHRYMARQLSPAAWARWFTQGGLLAPFRSE